MSSTTYNDLVKAYYDKAETITWDEARGDCDRFLSVLYDALIDSDVVHLNQVGSLKTELREFPARQRFNAAKGEYYQQEPHSVVKSYFKPTPCLKEAIAIAVNE